MRGRVTSAEAALGGRKLSRNSGGGGRHSGARSEAVWEFVIRLAEPAVFNGAEGVVKTEV